MYTAALNYTYYYINSYSMAFLKIMYTVASDLLTLFNTLFCLCVGACVCMRLIVCVCV